MATKPAIATVGFRQFARDLKAMDREAPRALTRMIRDTVEDIAVDARRRAPVRTGRLQNSIRGRAAGTRGRIVSSLPYANLIHWGGQHSPRPGIQPPIQYPRRAFMWNAVQANRDAAERRLADGAIDLARRHGWH